MCHQPPFTRAGAAPHMDLESVSLLLMSTSKSLSFAFMCLYSLYSPAIGVRSSFWTFLMETKGKGTEDHWLSPRGHCSAGELSACGDSAAYQPVEAVWPSVSWCQGWTWIYTGSEGCFPAKALCD